MSQLTKTLEERGLLRIAEALTLAARQEHERGDHELSVFLYDHARECCKRLRHLERIAENHERFLFATLPVEIPTEVLA
jgi:hypothetical protein